jgi:Zn-dependent membrane protease YugP
MHVVLLLVLVVVVLYGPQWWARRILTKHNAQDESFPGTGGEFAQHLLKRFELQHVVQVESIEKGDHYDPRAHKVRLSESHYSGKSLAAIVVAAHEVGHALQHAEGYKPLMWRTRLAVFAHQVERVGSMVMVAMPILAAVTRVPAVAAIMISAGLATLATPILVHLVTLPTEWHASFRRALPILAAGYLKEEQMSAAHKILTACALTYVAGSLASLLNLWRWLRLLRR